MRWVKPEYGDTRDREGFLFLPKRIGLETRWLEKASWEEEYYKNYTECGYRYGTWEPTRWLNGKEDT
jgi:hypothetical protein